MFMFMVFVYVGYFGSIFLVEISNSAAMKYSAFKYKSFENTFLL